MAEGIDSTNEFSVAAAAFFFVAAFFFFRLSNHFFDFLDVNVFLQGWRKFYQFSTRNKHDFSILCNRLFRLYVLNFFFAYHTADYEMTGFPVMCWVAMRMVKIPLLGFVKLCLYLYLFPSQGTCLASLSPL